MAKGIPSVLPYKELDLQELVLVKTNIAGYFFDGFLNVDHSLKTTITTHPVQEGASIADHAFNEPAEVSMTIKMSDTKKDIVSNQFAGIAYTRSVGAFNVLKELQKQRIPFQVHTRLQTYQNMMITSISVSDSLEDLYGLEATVNMQEILVANVKTVRISKRVQTTSSSSSGTKNGREIDSSILRMITDWAGIKVN